jgi:hypothetical protein
MLQDAIDRTETVRQQGVAQEKKEVAYQQAEQIMTPAAVEGPIKVEGSNISTTTVNPDNLAADAAKRCVSYNLPVSCSSVWLCWCGRWQVSCSIRCWAGWV